MTEEKLKEDKQKRNFYHHPSASYNNLKTNKYNDLQNETKKLET